MTRLLVSPAPAELATGPATAVRRLSDRLLVLARPLRVLEGANWPTAVETDFFANGARELPRVDRSTYRPLPLAPDAWVSGFSQVASEARRLLGHSPVGRLLTHAAQEYRAVVHMLAARGTTRFARLAAELYGSTHGEPWVPRFERALDRLLAEKPTVAETRTLSAAEAKDELAVRLAMHFGPSAPVRVTICDELAADACASGTVLKLRAGATFAAADIRMLEVHEGWAHVGTTLNARLQPVLTHLAKCPPSATRTQEGLAVFLEFLSGAAHAGRIRKLQLRLRGLALAESGADFLEVYRYFLGTTGHAGDSYHQAMRLFRGGLPTGGAFTKDISYARGLCEVAAFAARAPENLPWLFAGKTSLEQFDDLRASGLLIEPHYVPSMARDAAAVGQLARMFAA